MDPSLQTGAAESSEATEHKTEKRGVYLPKPLLLAAYGLFLLLILGCAVNAAAISRLQARANALEEQLARTESALAEAKAQTAYTQGEVSGILEQEHTEPVIAVDYDQVTRAIAHRGASLEAPENTLPAFRLAKQRGFSYVETDVQFTADGYPVCLHDRMIDRTSNGGGKIDDMTLEQVRQYDFGSWKSEEYAGTRIPTFEEFLLLCRNLELHPYVEMKPETVDSELRARALIDLVKACGMSGKVTWISFSPYLLSVVRDYDPLAPVGYLVEYIDDNALAVAGSLRSGRNTVFLDSCSCSDEECEQARAHGFPLEAWGIDREDELLRLNPYVTGVTSSGLIAGKVQAEAYIAG